jgi:hypothetical protein
VRSRYKSALSGTTHDPSVRGSDGRSPPSRSQRIRLDNFFDHGRKRVCRKAPPTRREKEAILSSRQDERRSSSALGSNRILSMGQPILGRAIAALAGETRIAGALSFHFSGPSPRSRGKRRPADSSRPGQPVHPRARGENTFYRQRVSRKKTPLSPPEEFTLQTLETEPRLPATPRL